MSEKPQPCRHKRPFCLECHGSEFQGGVSVKRTAIEYLKRNHPSACERAGLCETIGGRQYTVTLSCHGYVMASDYEALQAECEKLREHLQNLIDQTTPLEPVPGNPMWSRRIQLDEVIAERDQLRAECEKLRKDAEATRKSVKLLNYLFARNIIAMQSAVIEWEKGKGAAAGMQWIWNTLFGPGQIPDEDETDAQAYFDREIEPLDASMQGDQP